MTAFDLDFVRRQFPAFSSPALEGQAFFENAGGSYMCQQVIDRFDRYFTHRKVQPYGYFAASIDAGDEMDSATRRMARYLNVAEDEVMFGPSTSQNTYVLAQGFLARMKPGDALVVSQQEHEANTGAWRRLEQQGMEVRVWPIDPDSGRLSLEDLPPLLDDKVHFVAMTHCSNVVAEINPVRAVADLVHDAESILVVDGVSYCPHGLPDVAALGADIYLFSTYKTYGPHQGVMVVRQSARERIEPQAHYFNHQDMKKWLVPAGPDHAQVAACNGILDYFDALDAHHGGADDAGRPGRVETHCREAEMANLAPMLAYLSGRNDIRLIGPADPQHRAPTVAFTSNQHDAASIATALATHGVMAGAGDFYATRVIEAVGLSSAKGVVRLSFTHYTSRDEIDQALTALDRIL
ncbi:MAG: aminotransferase class V-fold PLP-dependent enzyme [Candidatus Puniceispirillales bacterium]